METPKNEMSLVTVTGYQLRNALKKWTIRCEMAKKKFPASLYKFPDETKDHPDTVMAAIEKAESAIAVLQTAQARYNLAVEISFQSHSGKETMSLNEAIKYCGIVQRTEKLWKQAAGVGGETDYYNNPFRVPPDRVIETGQKLETAKAQVSQEDFLKRISCMNDSYGAVTAAIAEGNAVKFGLRLNPGILD